MLRSWLLLLLLLPPVWAHHEAAVTIADLTAQITQTPELAELYYQRGVEYFNSEDLPRAEADFQRALALRPDFLPAKRYLARLADLAGQPETALRQLHAAIRETPPEYQFLLPGCHQLEAELLLKLQQPVPALAAIKLALAAPVPDLECWRLQAQIQRTLGQPDAALSTLKTAYDQSKAIILRNEWIDSLIDLARMDEALPVIESELAQTHFRSSWLIRRARLTLATQPAAAQQDLQAAIAELVPRLAAQPPPGELLADRGLAYALLGKTAAAQADLAAAQKRGVSQTSLTRLRALLAAK